jgi:uncharacterized membrane protein
MAKFFISGKLNYLKWAEMDVESIEVEADTLDEALTKVAESCTGWTENEPFNTEWTEVNVEGLPGKSEE